MRAQAARIWRPFSISPDKISGWLIEARPRFRFEVVHWVAMVCYGVRECVARLKSTVHVVPLPDIGPTSTKDRPHRGPRPARLVEPGRTVSVPRIAQPRQ